MAYTDQPSGARRTTAIGGVVIVHAALGLALVTGLATKFVPAPPPGEFGGEQIPLDPPPPPPEPEPTTEVQPRDPAQPPIYTPHPPIELPAPRPPIDTTDRLPPPAPPVPTPAPPAPTPIPSFSPTPAPAPSFTPVAAKPANDPGAWVLTSDYRSSWLNRGYEGTATFRLSIGANGRVQDCTITRSTGHGALDEATCKLVMRRARFNPAKDDTGTIVAGNYSSAIRWQIPD